MHVHVPKPLHGWKAFFNEIFVIVIGVLIALGFEQVVEELHWRHKVAEGVERLRAENAKQFRLPGRTDRHHSLSCRPALHPGRARQAQRRAAGAGALLHHPDNA